MIRDTGTNAVVAVTVGDPAGVGPEILARAFELTPGLFRVFGPRPIVEKLAKMFDFVIPVATQERMDGIVTGHYSTESGKAALGALEVAIDELADGRVGALVTGPIDKRAIAEGNLDYPGQTEWVADRLGVARHAMMLAGPKLRVALATTHLAIRDVASSLSIESIVTAATLSAEFLSDNLGIENPVIGILALNPHAGDNGKFGTEEATVIGPAIEIIRRLNISAFGPLSADTAFTAAMAGRYDALVAMYHDQGLGPLKTVHFSDAVNITLGLPRLRCSPDHGPAFDLAGRGIADHTSMSLALAMGRRHANAADLKHNML